MRQPIRTLLAVASLGIVPSCVVGGPDSARGDEAELTLSGQALLTELANSPTRYRDESFAKIAVMVDADTPTAIEIATSANGHEWTAWVPLRVRDVQAAERSQFNAEIVLPAAAHYFKFRGAANDATYLRVDTLAADAAFDWEISDDAAPAASLTAASASAFLANTGLTVISRADWGARAVNCGGTHTPRRITIHHTDTPSTNAAARVRQIQSYHRANRGWCDIGYHYLVDETGAVFEGRPVNKVGAHAAGANTGNIGIALIGDYTDHDPSPAQLDAVARLTAALAEKYNIDLSTDTVQGHTDVGTTATACPGQHTVDLLPDLVREAEVVDSGVPVGADPADPAPAPTGTPVEVTGYIYEGLNPKARLDGVEVEIAGKTATTDSTGFFRITDVPPGIQTVTVRKAGFATTSTRRNLASSPYVTVGMYTAATNTTTGSATLQGVVYRGNDPTDRVPNATVTLSTGQTLTANASGFFVAYDMPAGDVTVTATAGGQTNTVTRTLADGETVWGSVSLQ